MIHPRIDDLLEQRRLAVRARHRRGQAGSADQQLPPPARRGHVRGLPAAARRVALEELPDDGPRGDRRGQDHVRVPLALVARGSAATMARVLLGVTGGIAAYKACELVRLLVRAGHEVDARSSRPAAERFVRRDDVRGARRSESRASSTRTSRGRPARRRAALGEHAREARARARRQRPHRGRARVPRAAARRAGDEPAHVGAPGHAGERRACCASAASS